MSTCNCFYQDCKNVACNTFRFFFFFTSVCITRSYYTPRGYEFYAIRDGLFEQKILKIDLFSPALVFEYIKIHHTCFEPIESCNVLKTITVISHSKHMQKMKNIQEYYQNARGVPTGGSSYETFRLICRPQFIPKLSITFSCKFFKRLRSLFV